MSVELLAVSGATTSAVAAVLASFLAAIATAFAAIQGRRAQTAQIDMRVVTYLQDAVVQLEQRVGALRGDLFVSQNETDEERARRRRLEMRVADLQEIAERMLLAMSAAGIPVPHDATQVLQQSGAGSV